MRRTILLMVMATLSGNVVADWKSVGSNDSNYLFADIASIRKDGSKVKMLDMIDFKTRQLENDKFYQSSMAEAEYDCKENRYRNLSVTLYPFRRGGGDAISAVTNPSEWQPIPSGSGVEMLGNIACGKAIKVTKKKKKK